MSIMDYKKGLERNLWLYAIFRTFHKRTFLAVLVIYAVSVANVSVEMIGVVTAITAVVTMILEVPSGYISDKIGHKRALVFGAILIAISPLGLVFAQNFYGLLFASLAYWSGNAFHSGTQQAFLHETLIELGRDKEFATVSARAERWSLFVSLFLLALVPLTYMVDPRLPFVLGFIFQSFTVVASLSFTVPQKTHREVFEKMHRGFFALLSTVRKRGEVALFFFLGFVTALHNKLPEYKELYFQEIGVPLWVFGVVLSLTGIVGIILTYQVHWMEKFKARTYYAVDYLMVCVVGIMVGVFSHWIIGIGIFVLFCGYYRVRKILINSYLLRDCPTQNLKATYLSMCAFFESFNMIWTPVVLGYAVGYFGVQLGYMYFGLGTLFFLSVIYLFVFRSHSHETIKSFVSSGTSKA